MDLKPKVQIIPNKKVVIVEDAIQAYKPIEPIRDDDGEIINENPTLEEWLSYLASAYLQKLCDRGRDKLVKEASQKINIFK